MEPKLLEILYRSYAKELSVYLYSLCRNRELAEDLLHEIFVKAMLSLDERHPNFRAWLYLVGKNLCLNQMKEQGRTVSLEEKAFSDRNTPLEALLRQEKNQALFDALFSLASLQREVITLQYFSGFSQKEIARLLNLTPGNVRIIAYRAKKQLKERLEAQGYDQ